MVEGLKPVYEGAEAYIYYADVFGRRFIVKHRISKPYRHPLFDKMFRYNRTRIEAKILSELYLSGVRVPAPIMVDLDSYIIVMEYIDGVKLLKVIEGLDDDKLCRYAEDIGRYTGRMHKLHIYHGDLTLGNILVTDRDEVYIIDFGLAGYSMDVEEYAIDIHLLRRSLNAIAPEKINIFMNCFWKGYSGEVPSKMLKDVRERVREIALRGRYVSERLRRKYLRDRYVE